MTTSELINRVYTTGAIALAPTYSRLEYYSSSLLRSVARSTDNAALRAAIESILQTRGA